MSSRIAGITEGPLRKTQDEALADAISIADDGDSIVVHEEHCGYATPERCTCTPSTLSGRASS